MRKVALVVLAGVTLALVLLYVSNNNEPIPSVKPASVQDHRTVGAEQQDAVKPPVPSARAVATTASRSTDHSTELASQFFAGQTLKSLVHPVSFDPSKGSYYYATLALRTCETELNLLRSVDVDLQAVRHPQRVRSVQRIKDRCAELSADDYKLERRLAAEGIKAGDAGLKLVPSFVDSTSRPPSYAEQFGALLHGQDPGVAYLLSKELAAKSNGVFSIDGHTLTPIQQSSFPAALLLFACEVGVPCDETNWLVVLSCVGRGRCYPTLDVLLQEMGAEYASMFNSGQRYSYHAAKEIAARLLTARTKGERDVLRQVGR